MKLSNANIKTVKETLGVDPLEADNPAIEPLTKNFGEHTFYVGQEGLFVFEPDTEEIEPAKPNGKAKPTAGNTVRLTLVAAWTDENRDAIKACEPQPTEMTVAL